MARIMSADIEVEDHGFLIINVVCKYDSGEQSFCPILNDKGHEVIWAVLKAANVYKFSQLPGKNVKCVVRDGYIKGMEPIVAGFGESFDLESL